jgi:hypothetical protein
LTEIDRVTSVDADDANFSSTDDAATVVWSIDKIAPRGKGRQTAESEARVMRAVDS